mmetsp:Transcript_11967/g.22144  ORF Transcript_11967/g.22144 Transcript_11967/m.22144 type:complete len:290 (+) Transcript_11967:1926-2795(+)
MNNLIPKRARPLPEPSSSSSGPSAPSAPPAKKKRKRPPSAGHVEKSRARSNAKLGKKACAHRKAAARERGSAQHYLYGGGHTQGPFLSVEKDRILTGAPDVSDETMNFYYENWGDNQHLEVRESSNVSNPEGKPGGGKGVFAKKKIPAGTRVCPYVGTHQRKPCPAVEECQYDLRMDKDLYICGRDVLYDVGYLMAANQERHQAFIKSKLPCPPNYGRFLNTATAGSENNCQFELVGDGLDVMFISTTRDVVAGEELLVDYGEWFTIAPDDVSDAGTEVDSDGDQFTYK